MMAGIGVVVLGCLVAAVVSGGSGSGAVSTVTTVAVENSIVDIAPVGEETTTTVVVVDSSTPAADIADLAGDDPTTTTACTMTVRSLGGGDTGESVTCLQNALITAGFLTGTATGTYDNETANAVKKLQTERDLFVDGKTGRETALSLGVWPDETSLHPLPLAQLTFLAMNFHRSQRVGPMLPRCPQIQVRADASCTTVMVNAFGRSVMTTSSSARG